MTTSALYRAPRPTLSYELYPPRTPIGEARVWETVQRLVADGAARADYFSVTYGASGTTAERSQALVTRILAETPVSVIAHLTCVGSSRRRMRDVVESFLDSGVRDFLALRGDPPEGRVGWRPEADSYAYASELVALIREVAAQRYGKAPTDPLGRLAARAWTGGVSIAVAAYPGYAQGDGSYRVREEEIRALRAKQDAGADFAITQVFFDGAAYVELLGAAREAGITLPLVPGILPLTDARRIRKLCALNRIPEPDELLQRLESGSPEEVASLGLARTAAIVRDVLAAGAPGLHLYTFNRHEAVTRLAEEVLGEIAQPASPP